MHYISTTNIIIANNSLQVIIFTKLHTNFFLAMIKLFILFTIVLQVSQLPAQCPVTFNYDAAGNRILRTTPCALQEGSTERNLENKANTSVALQVNVSPNPSSGIFYLQWEGELPLETRFSVIDESGRMVLHPQPSATEIDLSDQPPALYYLLLQYPGGQQSHLLEKINP